MININITSLKFRVESMKKLFSERVVNQQQALQESGQGTKPVQAQKVSGQCSRLYGFIRESHEEQEVGFSDPYGTLPTWVILVMVYNKTFQC